MKSSLKTRLVISYILISLFLVFSLLFTVRSVLNNQFENYVRENKDKESQEIVNQVRSAFSSDGMPPSQAVLEGIGQAALAKGFILRVEQGSDILICMECMEPVQCGNMLAGMERNMASIYPNFAGKYEEQTFEIRKDGVLHGSVSLGYYGPFYYSNSDVQFLTMLNQIFILVAALALVIAVVLGLYMASRITNPIKQVIEQTGRIEQGHFEQVIELTSNTREVDQLIHSVNSLASTLGRQLQLRRRLAQDYAHEFRTPLTSLQTNIEAMIDGIWVPDKERLESLHEEVLRLTRMVSGIDSLVEMEQGKMALNKSSFDLLAFTQKIVANYESSLLAKKLALTVEGPPCPIVADRDKIGQVIVNLLSNAIKYTGENGSIRIRLSDKGGFIELSIADTGVGIAQEDLPNIFEHLYRTDKSRNSITGGSGVGLAVVKAIVEAHQGEIKVSSNPGQGSTFSIALPK